MARPKRREVGPPARDVLAARIRAMSPAEREARWRALDVKHPPPGYDGVDVLAERALLRRQGVLDE